MPSAIASINPAFMIALSGFPLTIPAGATLDLPIGYTSTGNPIELSTITIDNNDYNDSAYSFTIQSPDETVDCFQCAPIKPVFNTNSPTIRIEFSIIICLSRLNYPNKSGAFKSLKNCLN